MSGEEVPFRSMKITLSEEALERLAELRRGGAFRSDSATIEECIRTISDVVNDLVAEAQRALQFKEEFIPIAVQAETLRRIVLRIKRFDATRMK
jgi:Arc/MetJ-type ribon-helix-helix transcriptional regulator